jgi:hypothetical protein
MVMNFSADPYPCIARLAELVAPSGPGGQETTSPVGFDWKYRLDSQGTAQFGYWEDSQTFILEIFDIGQLTRRLHFDAGRLDVTISEINQTLKCQVQNP